MSSLGEPASARPSLLSRRPRHQNRLRLCHPQSPRGPKTSVLLVAVTASDESRRPSWSAAKIEADALVLESWPPRWTKLRYRRSGLTLSRTPKSTGRKPRFLEIGRDTSELQSPCN